MVRLLWQHCAQKLKSAMIAVWRMSPIHTTASKNPAASTMQARLLTLYDAITGSMKKRDDIHESVETGQERLDEWELV
jgi:hypothetical protein